jgi:hypothetical protein
MGIYIDGMKMPTKGYRLILVHADGTVQTTDGETTAVHVPPHYDLIDHNALKIAVMNCDCETRVDFLKHTMDCINKAPVVIPSDMPTYEAEEGET